MEYLDNLGPETKDTEYKIFAFNPLIISPEDAMKYLSTGKFVFNKSVINTIKNYLNIYLPKYIGSYFNPKSNLSQGILYFGISDDGIVTGIPYHGIIPIDFINYQINEIFIKYLKFTNEQIRDEIKSDLTVELIKLDKIPIANNSVNNPVYMEYLEQLKNIKFEHFKYKNKKIIWKKMFNPNILKLCDMINDLDTRKKIWEYAQEKTLGSKRNFVSKYSHLYGLCDVPNYWDLMSKVKSTYKFNPLEPGQIALINEDGLNIYYWITRWKDSKIAMLKLAKPRSPKKTIDSNYPIFLLSQSSKMIPKWVNANPKLNLYVIKIIIRIKKSHLIEYKNIENKWKKSYRVVKNDQPLSVPFI